MAASARSLLLSRFHDFSSSSSSSTLLFSRHLLLRRRRTQQSHRLSPSSPPVLCCLVSGVDGGGVADDFVSTRSSGSVGHREFSALANVLRRIEPLDTSVIGKGVSAPARDSMKRTISTMLGLLPSDQFSVVIRVSKQPLHRLLVSSIVTGYTLWNAEYRVSLMRKFESSSESTKVSVDSSGGSEGFGEEKSREREDGCEVQGVDGHEEMIVLESLGDFSPTALSYIQELESELATAKKDLDAQKQENMHLERNKDENNDLLDYLRSLEPDMVSELSQPSSSEVEEIIQQLVQNIQLRLFKDDIPSFVEDSAIGEKGTFNNNGVNQCDAIDTTRDYLAKLLFWCMLLGHHLRGLEYRLHLSCVVGLL